MFLIFKLVALIMNLMQNLMNIIKIRKWVYFTISQKLAASLNYKRRLEYN